MCKLRFLRAVRLEIDPFDSLCKDFKKLVTLFMRLYHFRKQVGIFLKVPTTATEEQMQTNMKALSP